MTAERWENAGENLMIAVALSVRTSVGSVKSGRRNDCTGTGVPLSTMFMINSSSPGWSCSAAFESTATQWCTKVGETNTKSNQSTTGVPRFNKAKSSGCSVVCVAMRFRLVDAPCADGPVPGPAGFTLRRSASGANRTDACERGRELPAPRDGPKPSAKLASTCNKE